MPESAVAVGGTTVSTAGVAPPESLDLWASITSESLMPCSIEQIGDGHYFGSLTPKVQSEEISIAVMANSATMVRHEARHIARTESLCVVAGLVLAGVSEVGCGDIRLRVPAGSMYVVDGSQPQLARTREHRTIMIRVARERLLSAAGIDEVPAAMLLEPVAHGKLAIDFFRTMVDLPAAALGNHSILNAGIDLLAGVVALGSGSRPTESSAEQLHREQVLGFLLEHLDNPGLTAENIARACGLSRRGLFRVFADTPGGPMTILRQARIRRACELLVARPDRTVAEIAAAAGFAGERNFYRAFRSETGMTPAEFREGAVVIPPGR